LGDPMLMRLEFVSILAAFAFVVLHIGTANAQGTEVHTDDGIYMRFRGWTGQILSLVNLGQAVDLVPREEYRSPFSISDHGKRGGDWSIPASITGSIAGGPGFIKLELELEDSRGEDRALTFRFSIPIDAVGWLWWDDADHSRPIEKGKRYLRYDDETRGVYPLCWYPLGTISQPDGVHAFSFAVHMDPPSLLRTGYDGEFFAEFDLGLSQATTTAPGRARVVFYLFNCRASWGFRDALRKYYELFPHHFAKRVTREGNWVARTPTQFISGIADFYPAFHEASSVKPNSVPFDNEAGIYAFRYDEPGAVGVAPSAPERVSYDAALAGLTQMAASDDPRERQLAAMVETPSCGIPFRGKSAFTTALPPGLTSKRSAARYEPRESS